MAPPSVPDPASLAQASQAALARQDWELADTLLRQRLEVEPGNPEILHNLGVAAYFRNAGADAVRFLEQAIAAGAGVQSNVLLGRIFESSGRDPDALRCYKAALKVDPAQFEALVGLGGIRDRDGDTAAARAYYARAAAVRPGDVDAVLKYSWSLWDENPHEAVRLTLDLLARNGGNLRLRAQVLEAAAQQVEMSERIRRGLPPYHAASVDDLFFTFARPLIEDMAATNEALLAADPGDDPARVRLGFARFCLGDRAGAEDLFRAAHKVTAGYLLDAVRFSPAFHGALRHTPEEELFGALPRCLTIRPPVADAAGVLFLSCDAAYFASFGYPMLSSLKDRAPGIPIHLHVMDAAPEDVAGIERFCDALAPSRIALTTELTGLAGGPKMRARCYYHAVRLVRFYETLRLYDCPLWMADVDALANRDLAPLFAMLDGKDIAIRVRAGRLEPQNQFSACLIGAAPSARSSAFFRQVAAYITFFHKQDGLRWGIDQLALYSVFADVADRGQAPALTLLGPREIDLDCSPDGFFWIVAGARKFNLLKQGGSAQGEDTRDSRFAVAFRRALEAAQTLTSKVP